MNNYLKNERYFVMKIRKNLDYQTLEKFFQGVSLAKNKINYLFTHNCCYLNGELASKHSILRYNDYLMVDISNFEHLDYLPLDYNLKILYEDDYLLIVNKPSGYIIYPDNKEKNGTMANMIAAYYQKKQMNCTIRHCHRLDMDTTGCLIYAKDLITQSAMEQLFEENKFLKNYLAIVEGNVVKDRVISTPIAKDRHHNSKMIVSRNGGKWAKTICKVISHNQNFSLLKIRIESGRTHQIRVHLSSIHHPIYGDELYGAKIKTRMMLHCYQITFVHPILGKKIDIKAPIYNDFKEVIKKEKLTCEKRKILL